MMNRKKLEDLSHQELLTATRQLLAEADALSSRIAAVNEISVAINKSLDLDAILRVVAKQAKWLLDFEHCSISLERDSKWDVIMLFGKDNIPEVDFSQTKNVGHVLQHRYPKIINDGLDCIFLGNYPSQLILPIESSNKLLGTINFASKDPDKYTQDDVRIGYMLSLQLSSAIHNAHIVKQLNQTQAELELRIEDLDAYNHTIAHDLKSPLSTILLSAQIAKLTGRNMLPEKGKTALDSIERNTKHMNEMIDRLLWLAKLRQDEIELEAVNVQQVIDKVRERFSAAIDGQQISLIVDDNMPPAMGQSQWIEEVFANFLSNAIKYTGQDNLSPEVQIRAFLDGEFVCYQVIDNGEGIKEEDQKTLFEMFSRANQTGVEGTGIGLSIVNRIVTRMDGTCGVSSTYGEGSTFWFKLKAAPSVG